MTTFFDEIRRNKFRSALITALFFVLVLCLGSFLGWYYTRGAPGGWIGGVIIALLIATTYFLISWYAGGRMILAITGARKVTRREEPLLINTVEGLAIAAGIPAPECYVIRDGALNAFATGRDPKDSAVCVTTGLLEKMNRQELEGVIAHEISHIKNYDIRVMLLAAVLVGVITLLSDFLLRSFLWGGGGGERRGDGRTAAFLVIIGLLLAILSPLIGELIKLAVSRQREYLADATAAMLTRYPPGLASALRKIAADPDPLVDRANKATAHLFISTPFRKKKGVVARLFSTHPPIEERIKRLEAM